MKKKKDGRCRDKQRGATAVEFAIVAPAFIILMFGVIEYSRYFWQQQTAQDVVRALARCASSDAQECGSAAQLKTRALNEADSLGLQIIEDNVTVDLDVSCNNYQGNRVIIETDFMSPLEFALPSVRAESCFPLLN